MNLNNKQQWSEEETLCFLSLWSSSEIQDKFQGAHRTKPLFEQMQREMAAAGYERSINQMVNKLKKLKKDFRDQKVELGGCSSKGRPRRNPYFHILNSILGDPQEKLTSEAPNPATVESILRPMVEDMVEDTVVEDTAVEAPPANNTDSEFSSLGQSPWTGVCSSPSPSSSSSFPSCRPGKRKRDLDAEMIESLQRLEDKLQEDREREDKLSSDFLKCLEKMGENSSAMLGLMERVVCTMEGLAKR